MARANLGHAGSGLKTGVVQKMPDMSNYESRPLCKSSCGLDETQGPQISFFALLVQLHKLWNMTDNESYVVEERSCTSVSTTFNHSD